MSVEPFNYDSKPLSPPEVDLSIELERYMETFRGRNSGTHADNILLYLRDTYNVHINRERLREVFEHISRTSFDPKYIIVREGDFYYTIGNESELNNYLDMVSGYKHFIDHHLSVVLKIRKDLEDKARGIK